MKSLILFFTALMSFSSLATIQNSQLELRHQNLIEKSIMDHCQLSNGSIVEINTKTTAIKVDNGITDFKFETLLEVHQRVDQNLFDVYKVTVKSSYASGYDHSSQNWGTYLVDEISNCVQK